MRFYDDYCEIKGTTEQGNNQRFLVVPAYIDGVEVRGFGYSSLAGVIDMIYGDMTWPDIDSGSIEKVYFESVMEMYLFSFRNCPNMEKVFYMSIAPYDCVMNYDIYYPRAVYDAMTSDGSYYIGRFAANISYYYIYENAENGGYYWIDDCDYGGKIEFIPPDPVRDGYTFGGWYKGAECINAWNFGADTLPEKQTETQENSRGETEEVTVYQETILYAKWIQN